MAKAIAKCTCSKCGKEFEIVKIFHSRKEATSYEEYMESNTSLICPDCRKAAEDVAIENRSAGMPELTGTEKQIAWARKIRVSLIETLDHLAKEELIDENGNPHAEGLRIYKLALAEMIAAHTDAAWWINNRSNIDVNWFWGSLLNPAVEKYSNTEDTTETTTETTTEENSTDENKELDDMTANIADIIAYYNDNDKLADKHTRLAAEFAAVGDMSGSEKHETAARICEARLDGLLSCLRMLGHEVIFEGETLTIKA